MPIGKWGPREVQPPRRRGRRGADEAIGKADLRKRGAFDPGCPDGWSRGILFIFTRNEARLCHRLTKISARLADLFSKLCIVMTNYISR